MIAEQSNKTKTLTVLDRLEDAHTAIVDWLMTRLAEVAVGGPTALRPTTMQSVVGVSRRATQFPVQQAAATLNRSADVVGRIRQRSVEAVATNVERAREFVDAAGDIWTAGRDATLKRTEEVAEQRGGPLNGEKRQQRATRARSRRHVGTSDPRLRRAQCRYGIARIGRLGNADDVRTILAYETANKHRKGCHRRRSRPARAGALSTCRSVLSRTSELGCVAADFRRAFRTDLASARAALKILTTQGEGVRGNWIQAH